MNNRTKENYVDLFIENYLKKNKNLPYVIVINNQCPDKNNKCNKHHDQAIVESYDKDNNTFFVSQYLAHKSEYVSRYEVDHNAVKNLFQSGMRRRLFNTNDLKKKLNLDEIFRTELIQTKVSKQEKQIIQERAKKDGMTLSVYMRHKALS